MAHIGNFPSNGGWTAILVGNLIINLSWNFQTNHWAYCSICQI